MLVTVDVIEQGAMDLLRDMARLNLIYMDPPLENPAVQVHGIEPFSANFPTIDDLRRGAAEKAAARQAYRDATGKDPFEEIRDSRQGRPFFGGVDGVEYQRSMRDEWPD